MILSQVRIELLVKLLLLCLWGQVAYGKQRSRILVNGDSQFEYVATTDVSFLLNLALDAAEMRKADKDLDLKSDIYYKGKNAFYEDSSGQRTVISLAGLSLAASGVMSGDPLYNIYRNAFYDLGVDNENDSAGNFDGHPVEEYANTLVVDLFELNSTRTETEGAIVLNVWMAVAHELHSVLRGCRSNNQDEMNGALDRATALWIGADQIRGDNLEGHLLYNLAELAGELFGQDEGESRVNTGIMQEINSIQFNIASGTCAQQGGYVEMRDKIRKVLSFMTVPLVQTLIHHIVQIQNEGASDMVELYALALLPRVAACEPTKYKRMLEWMVFNSLTIENQLNAIETVQDIFSCLDVTCADIGSYLNGKIPQCSDVIDATSGPPGLASYAPVSDVRAKSYIDRDMMQLRLFMEWEAYETAKDYYLHGYNSLYSLADLATNKAGWLESREYLLYNSYFQAEGDPSAHDIVLDVLDGIAPFDDNASDDQKVEVVMSVLKSVVMYLATVGELESAVLECENHAASPSSGTQEAIDQFWDGGAAYFIGSVEGSSAGGDSGGELLYGASKTLCGSFGTCEPNDSAANEVITNALNFGKTALQNNNCDEAKAVLHDTIEPALFVPLAQGTLYYASKSANLVTGIDSTDFGAMYGYARGVLPRMNEVYASSATSLRTNTVFQLTSKPLPQGFDAVVDAFRDSLPHMSTDCKSIGNLNGYGSLCLDESGSSATSTGGTQSNPDSDSAPVPAPAPQPVPNADNTGSVSDLAFGRYTFKSPDAPMLDSLVALDVKDIRQAGDITQAENTYVNGKNVQQGLYGQVNLMSLSDVSSQAHLYMKEDPIFNYFRYALYDESTFESTTGNASWPFADMVVRLALSPDHGNDAELAAEAAVIMNAFFLIQHRLYRAARECKQGLNPSHLIDSAVALWIGREQQEGKFNSGWMMYAVAQQAAKDFGMNEGESAVNSDLMEMLNEAQVLADFCPSQPNNFLVLRVLTSRIIEKFSIALVQRLMYFMSEDNLDYTELYGLSVIPQAVACDSKVYQELKGALIDSFSRDVTINDAFYEQMGSLLQCMRITCEDLGDTSRASPKLQEIVANTCKKLDSSKGVTKLAGYVATFDVSEESRIDLDIRQIGVFMKTRAYQAATEYYQYGANSLKTDRAFLSLQYLATAPERESVGTDFTIFSSYFGNNDNYADSIITAALRQENDYENASRLQLNEIVVRSLQTMVSYMAVLWMLSSAVNACQSGTASQEYLDTAVAYFVGSIEGPEAGGIFGGYGELLFGLAKEQCPHFDACSSTGDAEINKRIMSVLTNMQSRLAAKDCAAASSIYNDVLLTTLPVSMIEGTLYHAAANEKLEARSTSKAVADGSILAGSVLPIVDSVNPESATAIYNNMAFDLNRRPVSGGKHVVFNAFAKAINAMGVDCNEVGILRPESRGICEVQDDSSRPAPETPTNLGDDLYVTTTYVQDRANIAIDIKEMEDALKDGRLEFAKLIYAEGKNSDIYDDNGITVGHRSVKAFATTETSEMVEEPLMNLFVYSLQDDSGRFMEKDARQYADSIVNDAFNVKSLEAKTLASEAAVALNVWMYLAHILHKTLDDCKNGLMTDKDGAHAIDEAVAYWIGDGQIAGDAERGHLLYALAEEMGEQFQMDLPGQVRTNTNILRLFHQAKIELSFPDACAADPSTYNRIYHIVNKIVAQMTIPLLQSLIHYMRQNDAARVKVYAHAVVPLLAPCNPATFNYLRDKLMNAPLNVVEVEPIIDQILSTLPCLGLQCEDIGVHKSEIEPSCTDPPVLTPLAGYKPASDVREFAQFDLDIREIDILMQMGAYRAAEDLYANGKHIRQDTTNSNAGQATSLSFLATTSARSVVPQFDSFVRYFDGNEKYADYIVRDAMTNEQYGVETRRLLAVRTCQYMIMFMAALQGMHEAIGECEANEAVRDTTSAEFWDKAAASIIGHLEGTENGGSREGMLFFALAKDHCSEFDTCSSPSPAASLSAEVNDKIVSLLYAGRGAVLSRSCSELRKATAELEPLLLVPVIQATLSASERMVNEGIRQKSLSSNLVEGHAYANVVIPLVEDVDRDAAQTIEDNLSLTGTPFRDGLGAVVESFFVVYSGLGLKCDQIGQSDEVDACNGTMSSNLDSKTITGIAVGVSLTVLAGCGIVALLLAKRKKDQAKDTAPVFTRSKGEMSHTDDLLTKGEAETSECEERFVDEEVEEGEDPEEAAMRSKPDAPLAEDQEVV
ncbi:expressed unknown protein [Seminavis robusta]|uniref:Uncharacterized protein n=1 Tax=Seminavis robusta TaxID=568900 RepID=A0A9N8D7J4_9STRA|nr:expressed unknown protein [Seminavis robusta]|eukprot:Sro30_g019450.1 n/a (2232) ;mRNA; f:24899-31823